MVFKNPPIKDERQIKSKNGKVNLDKFIVNSYLSGFSPKPGAIKDIINGIKISKIITKRSKIIKVKEKISDKNLLASIFPFFSFIPVRMGINAEFKDPSANNLLKRLGNLNETKKASETRPAPNNFAIKKSRKYPSNLLRRVKEPMIEKIFKNKIFPL